MAGGTTHDRMTNQIVFHKPAAIQPLSQTTKNRVSVSRRSRRRRWQTLPSILANLLLGRPVEKIARPLILGIHLKSLHV